MARKTKKAPTVDATWVFRDIGDVIRARNIFFVPFFGAFIAMLVAKSEQVAGFGWFLQGLFVVTFFSGIYYAHHVSNLLYVLEGLRFAINFHQKIDPLEDGVVGAGKSKEALKEQLGASINHEAKAFKWVMVLLYLSAFMFLQEVLWAPQIREWAEPLILDFAVKIFR